MVTPVDHDAVAQKEFIVPATKALMEPMIGQRWKTRDGSAQTGTVVDVDNGYVGIRGGWGIGSIPLIAFLADWMPVDEDTESTGQHG